MLNQYAFGAIFDWDGVIVDSSAAHRESWERLARETGLALPSDHFHKGFGRRNESVLREVLRWEGDFQQIRTWGLRKEEIYREIIRKNGIELLPGARTLLDQLRQSGIPTAIGSSTAHENIELIMDLCDIRDRFLAVVSGDDVARGKPDPEVFLAAARGIGVPPQRCVVFEDAIPGLEAARAAGMALVAVTTTNPRYRLGSADRVVDQLSELSVGDLTHLIEENYRPSRGPEPQLERESEPRSRW